MNSVIPFDFEGNAVRVIDRAGEPWFVAADVCRVLDIVNVTQAVGRLDDDEVTLCQIEGSHRPTNLINESGLYALIVRSDKPNARPFRKWVTAEVLPSIRRTGRYELPQHDGMPSAAMAAASRPTSREVNAFTRLVGEVRRCTSRPVAVHVYVQTPLHDAFPLPDTLPPPRAELDVPRAYDGPACLSWLMSARVSRSDLTVADLARVARADHQTRAMLGHAGVLVRPDNWGGEWVAVACTHPRLQRAFAGSPWSVGWDAALLTIPGARPAPDLIMFSDRARRAVLVPWGAVDGLSTAC